MRVLAQTKQISMNPILTSGSTILDELCESLPFLRQLPDNLIQSLDTSTLYVPDRIVAEICTRFESRFRCHIMTYRTVPLETNRQEGRHLCRLLVPACITESQLEELKEGEVACRDKGVVFVAYTKPLQLRDDLNISIESGNKSL